MTKLPDDQMIEITSPEEIPSFTNEDEDHAFWSSHCIGQTYLDSVGGWSQEDGLPVPLPPKRKRRRLKTAEQSEPV
jgi:hypothetical protein